MILNRFASAKTPVAGKSEKFRGCGVTTSNASKQHPHG